MLTDSHVHFDVFHQEGRVGDILQRADEAGVKRMVAIGGSPDSNALSLLLAQQHPQRIWPTIGYDRDLAKNPPSMDNLIQQAKTQPVVALGEMGLDYHYEKETAEQQKHLFEAQLQLARETQLPVVVHSRESDDDTISMLSEHARLWKGDPACLGVLHCFTGSSEFARRLLPMGFMISFSGIITFKNAAALRETAVLIPDDRLLIETDAPYLAPVPHRGKQNEPAYVLHVAEAIASLKKVSVQHVAEVTSANAERLFNFREKS